MRGFFGNFVFRSLRSYFVHRWQRFLIEHRPTKAATLARNTRDIPGGLLIVRVFMPGNHRHEMTKIAVRIDGLRGRVGEGGMRLWCKEGQRRNKVDRLKQSFFGIPRNFAFLYVFLPSADLHRKERKGRMTKERKNDNNSGDKYAHLIRGNRFMMLERG